ncbi:MAG TPA: metalloregulator ArsR/SmtB family transcription factor [Ktedonobacterales bacterium]|jgi:DNA-binding transcriptional ArsR family regulator|nr:metalloregulator ArsR/SmtB family transcription factor [Ktedonobacterales bacterium]
MNEDRCDLLCLELTRAEALRGQRLSAESAGLAAAAAQALADPTRLMIADLLRDGGELCVCDLAWLTGRAINLVSHHLKTLRSGGLVSSRREGKLVLYALTVRGHTLVEALLQPTPQEVMA